MNTESLLVALAILTSSFFGSWHCGAMCGPIVSFVKVRGALSYYHIGRLISYVSLGIIAGAAGSFLLESSFQIVRIIATCLLAAALALFGMKLIFPKSFARFTPGSFFHKILDRVHVLTGKRLYSSGFALGMLSGLLPCGWLYTYVMAALATQSPLAGGVTLALFWAGGLPILTAVPTLLKAGIASAGLRQQKIAGAVLILSSLYSLSVFVVS